MEFSNRLADWNLRASYSSTGDCFDNAAMESVWATLKREVRHLHGDWRHIARSELRTILFDYIETFYNRARHPPKPTLPQQHELTTTPVSRSGGTPDDLHGRIDIEGANDVWQAAVGSEWHTPDVWVHGDVAPSNLLVRNDRLCGVIDFGCSAVGDPACDLTMAWTVFEGSSRSRFMQAIPVDAATWDRARGWALWKAVIALPELPEEHPRNNGSQFGWRWPAVGVADQIITDFQTREQP